MRRSAKSLRRVRAAAWSALLIGLAGCGPRVPATPAVSQAPPAVAAVNVVRRIGIAETVRRLDAGEPIVFLDTRERAIGPMIPGAVHVPYSWLGKWADAQPRDAFIVAYCACLNEASAARTVLDLQRDGFTNAYTLRGGVQAWAGVGRPVDIRR